MPGERWNRIPQSFQPASRLFPASPFEPKRPGEHPVETQAIAIIACLIDRLGLETALRRLATVDPSTVTLDDLQALSRGRMSDPDCHFSGDPAAFDDEVA